MGIPTTPMTVVGLKVDSFKRLRAANLTPPETGLVLLRGKNGAGKSSVIEAMLAALLGKRAAPELPITEGAHGAETVVDLKDILVVRRWKRGSDGKATSSLTVEDATGGLLKSPQAILDNLVGRFADPVAFLSMRPDEQVKTVLGILGLDRKLNELEAQAQKQFDERRDLGRDADRLTKAENEIARELEDAPPPPEEAENVQELRVQLNAAINANFALDAAAQRADSLVQQGTDLANRITRLEAELVELRAKQDRVRMEWRDAKDAARQPRADVEGLTQRLHALEDADQWTARRAMHQQAAARALAAREAHSASDAALARVRGEIAALLAGAEFPIPGMAYDAESKTLTLEGIPFGQASQGERLRAAAAVAMSGEPLIKVLFAREGSLLDEDSRAQLGELAHERGFQLWLEVVDSNPEGAGIWIEDGEAFQNG